jgi:hypothetical protein
MVKKLTISRGAEETGHRPERLRRARGRAVDATVLEIPAAAVGVDERRRKLARYVSWSAEELTEFNEALAAQRPVDDRVCR